MKGAYFITGRQREQAGRMAEKWRARSEAFYCDEVEGWGRSTAGHCKTAEDAENAEKMAERIEQAVARLSAGVGIWADVQAVQAAVAGRDALDGGIFDYPALVND